MHYGLVPRANRGIFAINELPDLAGKIQVGLFNILQEGDVQIKGYPVRLPLDLMLVFSANPEDYTARGKIITPLKDRIGSEIRTHYPASRQQAMADHAAGSVDRPRQRGRSSCRSPIRARGRRGGRLPGAPGSEDRQALRRQPAAADLAARERRLERRAPRAGRRASTIAVPRVTDIYAAIPAITGKFELEYEGELKGADNVARELIRGAVATVFDGWFPNADLRQVTEWFDLGGNLQVDDALPAADLIGRTGAVQGLHEAARARRARQEPGRAARSPSAIDFVLEGSTRSARSAAPSKASSRPPSSPSRAAPRPWTRSRERDLPLDRQQEEVLQLTVDGRPA